MTGQTDGMGSIENGNCKFLAAVFLGELNSFICYTHKRFVPTP
jgi:hypothetical protein